MRLVTCIAYRRASGVTRARHSSAGGASHGNAWRDWSMIEPLALVGKVIGFIFGAGVVFALIVVVLVMVVIGRARG